MSEWYARISGGEQVRCVERGEVVRRAICGISDVAMIRDEE